MSDNLPPRVEPAAFAGLLDEARALVGAQWVLTDPEGDLLPYLDDMSPVSPRKRVPSAVVAPADVEQLQRLVRRCNELRIPVWYYGTGKNFGYGGPAPRLSGYLVLDLKRMNRILEVDEDSGFCLVEPGVSYIQLYQHLQATGSNLWIDCAAPAWGGVIGNAMEHGAGYTPYGDHFAFQCGMEVMLADGTLVRTGMGAMPGSKAWQLFKYGYGPYVDGMFTQGNFGIVTKMGMWLMPRPPAYKPFMFAFEKETDVHEVMERLRPLKTSLVYQNAAVLEHLSYTAGVQVPRVRYWQEKSPMPREVWEQIRRDLDVGWWNLWGAVYGLPENVEIQWQVIRDAFAAVPGARVFLERPPEDVGWAYRTRLMRGEPNMTEFNIVNWRGGGHINFTPIAPMRGAKAVEAMGIVREVMNRYGFDYITEYVATFRGLIKLLMVMFDPDDPDDVRRAYDCSREVLLACARIGFGELKGNLEFMDLVQGTYFGQDNGVQKTLQKLKDGLDPNGILAPGKSGIWPGNWPPEDRPAVRGWSPDDPLGRGGLAS